MSKRIYTYKEIFMQKRKKLQESMGKREKDAELITKEKQINKKEKKRKITMKREQRNKSVKKYGYGMKNANKK